MRANLPIVGSSIASFQSQEGKLSMWRWNGYRMDEFATYAYKKLRIIGKNLAATKEISLMNHKHHCRRQSESLHPVFGNRSWTLCNHWDVEITESIQGEISKRKSFIYDIGDSKSRENDLVIRNKNMVEVSMFVRFWIHHPWIVKAYKNGWVEK